MSNNEIKKMLADVDAVLDKISVRGDDVFMLANARHKLKQVFDGVNATQAETGVDHEYNVNRKDDPT